jgi:hypothetical protein
MAAITGISADPEQVAAVSLRIQCKAAPTWAHRCQSALQLQRARL